MGGRALLPRMLLTSSAAAGYSSSVSAYVAGRPEYPAALLFDLGVAGDFVTDITSATQERRHDGTFIV